jgi:peptide/nickel transport system permease protein
MDTHNDTGQLANSGFVPPAEPDTMMADGEEDKLAIATPRQLMWWKFRKHRVAIASGIILIIFYVSALFAGFLSPKDPNAYDASYKFVPPMPITFLDGNGDFTWRPGVHGLISNRDPETYRITYETDKTTWYPLHFFVKGPSYKLLGLVETDIHLFGLVQIDWGVTCFLGSCMGPESRFRLGWFPFC